MADVHQVEWLNQNALRNYPIRENAQRRPSLPDGTLLTDLALPTYVITDFVMSVPSEAPTDVYVSKLVIVGDAMTFVFSSGDGVVASVYVDRSSHKPNTGYRFSGTGSLEGSVGCLVVGNLSSLSDDLPDGVYNYAEAETVFEYRCVRPSAAGVASLSIENTVTGYRSKKLRGDVKLVAGTNISLKYDPEDNAIWINADGNAGYNDKCDCGTETTVKTINGISVENVTLIGDDCVSVTTVGNTLKISDTCSKPCCGCAEIDFINEKIAQMNTAVRKLDSYAGVLDTRITELKSAYVQTDTGATP